MDKPEINSSRQELFDYMSQEHGLTLLQSEMMEIEKIVLRSSQLEAMEKDVITHNTHHKFKLWDRIKILLGKKLTVHSEIETKNLVILSGKVKCTTTVSRLFPIPKKESQGGYTSQKLQMDKKQIKIKYLQLLKDVATKDFYTTINLSNRVNCYACECNHVTKTRDVDAGVTPAFHSCESCGKLAHSTFYQDIVPMQEPTQEWYRPPLKEVLNMDEGMLDHVLNGGLDCRKIERKSNG